MSHYLVTGGAGFIGRHLCRLLVEAGHDLTVLDDLSSGDAAALPTGVRLIEADICDASALADAATGTEGVFHLAAISSVEACSQDRPGTQRVNLDGTAAVLDALDGRPVVYTSSAAVYGDQSALPIREDATLNPISPYAEDKISSEGLIRAAQGRAVIVRPFNVYGAGQAAHSPYSGVISKFVARAQSGDALRINGTGDQTRDFIHVHDVVRALAQAITTADSDAPTLNLCRGISISVLDLAGLINSLTGNKARIEHGPVRHGDILHSCGDPAAAQRLLKIRAEIEMRTGLMTLLGNSSGR